MDPKLDCQGRKYIQHLGIGIGERLEQQDTEIATLSQYNVNNKDGDPGVEKCY